MKWTLGECAVRWTLGLAALLGMAIPVLAQAPTPTASELENLRQELVRMDLEGDLSFLDDAASVRFRRLVRRLDRTTRDLSNETSDCTPENHRGRATLVLRQLLGQSTAASAIALMPRLVTENDMAFMKELARRIGSSQILPILEGYFTHPSRFTNRNRKGNAAEFLLNHVSRSRLPVIMKTLPEYISEGELESFELVVSYTVPHKLEEALREFFGT